MPPNSSAQADAFALPSVQPSDKVARIHGVWHDLSAFARIHPGGPVALQLAFGRDATVLLHSHHPFTDARRLGALLEQMRVPPEEQARLDRAFPDAVEQLPEEYAFDLRAAEASLAALPAAPAAAAAAAAATDAFEEEVKALFRGHFEAEARRRGVTFREATKCPPERWLLSAALFSAAVAFGVLPMLRASPPALLIAPTLLWVWQVNFFHDAAHFALSSSWLTNAAFSYLAPWFSSPLEWYHMHVIGHHIYTNVPGRDPDLYHSRKIWRFQRQDAWLPLHAFMEFTTPIVWTIAVPSLAMVRPFTTRASQTYNDCVRLWHVSSARYALHVAGRAATAAIVFGWPFVAFAGRGYAASTTLAFATVPYLVFSTLFMLFSQINHHSSETSEAHDRNWYRHQVMTSQDVAPDSFLAFVVSGGLNLQIEHHLFPTVNHWHLRALQPRVQALCAKHGVPYARSESFAEAVGKIWSHMSGLKANPSGSK